MQRSSRGKLAFHCGPVKCNFCQFCINFGTVRKTWKWIRMVEEVTLEPEAPLVWSNLRTNPTGDESRTLPAGKNTGQHLWVTQKLPIRGTCEGSRRGSTPWTGLLKPIINYGMTISPSYSTLILAKWSLAKCSLSSWPSVNLSYFQCKDEGDLFSRCFEYPAHACHVTFVMLAELLRDVGAKAESNMAWSFEDSRSSAGTGDLAALLHRSWYPERWRLGGVANKC